MKVLIDTNVVLDCLLKREPFVGSSAKTLKYLLSVKTKIYLSSNMVTDIFYFVFKETKNPQTSKEIIKKLFNTYKIIAVDEVDCKNALSLPIDDFEDALAVVCAKKIKADFIITRNAKHFGESPVIVVTPEEFINNNVQ